MTAPDRSDTSFATQTTADFVAAVAAKCPAPGGGAVAAITLAHAVALGRMTLAYTLGRPRYAQHAEFHARVDAELADAAPALLKLADADADAYGRLNALLRLPEDDPTRNAAMSSAVDDAIAAPLAMARLGASVATDLLRLVGTVNPSLASDLAIAGDLAAAGTRAALRNVTANLSLVVDEPRRADLAAEATDLRQRATEAGARCESTAVGG